MVAPYCIISDWCDFVHETLLRLKVEGERGVGPARRGSISRLGFYTLEEQRRAPAESSKGGRGWG